jgi:hypothetical protein
MRLANFIWQSTSLFAATGVFTLSLFKPSKYQMLHFMGSVQCYERRFIYHYVERYVTTVSLYPAPSDSTRRIYDRHLNISNSVAYG